MKFVKKTKRIWTALILAAGFVLTACGGTGGSESGESNPSDPSSVSSETENSAVKSYEVPDGVERYSGAKLYVEGEEIPLYATRYNDSQVWSAAAASRRETGFAYFDFQGSVRAKIVYESKVDSAYLVRPSAYGVLASVTKENRSVEFVLDAADNYTVEPVSSPKQAIYLFCNPIGKEEFTAESEEVKNGNVLYFGAGLHTAANDSRIGPDNVVRVRSGQTVYLASGAVLRAKIQGDNVSDVRVAGRGILDGSAFVRDPGAGLATVPIEFNRCTDVVVEDIVLNDPAGWCVQYYFVEGGRIDNVRMLSSRSNGDGVSLQSCKNITVSRVFARTWDDCLVVKNYPEWSDRSKQGATENILFEYCTIWADLAQCMEVGYETVGKTMQNITFRDITVLHAFHKPVMSIHNGNNADIKRVVFENITVEDASMGQGDSNGNRQLAEFTAVYSASWSDGHGVTELGSIDGVTVSNVWVYSAKTPIEYRVYGSEDTRSDYAGSLHYVDNVTFDGIKIGTKTESEQTAKLYTNEYARNVKFLSRASSEISGAAVYGKK